MDQDIEQLSYPTGRFKEPANVTFAEIGSWITDLEALPEKMRNAVDGLSDAQLDTPYRPGGWHSDRLYITFPTAI